MSLYSSQFAGASGSFTVVGAGVSRVDLRRRRGVCLGAAVLRDGPLLVLGRVGLEILLLYFGDRRRRPDRSCGVFVLVLAGRAVVGAAVRPPPLACHLPVGLALCWRS